MGRHRRKVKEGEEMVGWIFVGCFCLMVVVALVCALQELDEFFKRQ